MYLHKSTRIIISQRKVAIFWVLSVAIILALAVGPYHLYDINIGDTESVWSGAFYTTFSRPAWALVIFWIIIACHNGYGGFVNRFLSWTIWAPFARVSYSLYIMQYIFIFYWMQMRYPFHYSISTLVS